MEDTTKPANAEQSEELNKTMSLLSKRLAKVAEDMERTQIADYVQLMNSPGKLFWTNVWAGLARGVGIAIGITIVGGTIVYMLGKLGALDIPFIGDYIAELVKYVERNVGYGR